MRRPIVFNRTSVSAWGTAQVLDAYEGDEFLFYSPTPSSGLEHLYGLLGLMSSPQELQGQTVWRRRA